MLEELAKLAACKLPVEVSCCQSLRERSELFAKLAAVSKRNRKVNKQVGVNIQTTSHSINEILKGLIFDNIKTSYLKSSRARPQLDIPACCRYHICAYSRR